MDYQEALRWLSENEIRPNQSGHELMEAHDILKERDIASFLEIGSRNGGTLLVYGSLCKDGSNIVSIDCSPLPKTHVVLEELNKNHNAFLIEENSRDDKTLKTLLEITGEFDLLHIDGDHSYEGVKHDYETYEHLVNPGGVVLIHDINGTSERSEFPLQVKRFWEEIKPTLHNYEEIIKKKENRGCGIGVIFK